MRLVTILTAETWDEMPGGPQGICTELSGNGAVCDKALPFCPVNYFSTNAPLQSVIRPQ